MRALWWTFNFWPMIGGSEVIGNELALGLQEKGHELAVVADDAGGTLAARESYHGIPIARFPFHSALEQRDIAHVAEIHARLRDLVREIDPDLVHLHTLGYPAFFCQRAISGDAREKTRLLITRHELFVGPPGEGTLSLQMLRDADWVACCSQAVLVDVQGAAPDLGGRSSAVLNGLDPPVTEPALPPTDPPVLLCVGRLTRQKGFDLAISALATVRDRFPRARLVIAGDGPERPSLEEQANRVGQAQAVHFAGWVAPSRVPEVIRDSSVVLVPSREGEAFGLVALQAAQMGRPVVAARVGGLPEVVADGETGLLFEPEDPSDMARAIMRLLERPEEASRFGRAGRRRALDLFTGRRYVDEYDRLYRHLARTVA